MDVGRQLEALADPTRRAIFDLVRARSSSVREITDELPVSQPAVSQHLKVLRDAGLVTVTVVGRRHIHQADPEGIAVLRDWINGLWDEPLDAFAAAAEPTRSHRRNTP